MTIRDMEAVQAAFAVPGCDGRFDDDFAYYLNDLGQTRPSVVLAFAPKAAGTYLRTAATLAVDGALVRTVHAQGGRDASFYLPTFLNYYAGSFPDRTMVTHVHMQALPANRHVIEALDLRPVIMLRAIPDMLASYADMLDADQAPDNWLNIRLAPDYPRMSEADKGDFLIDMMAPWYVSYFATWLEYADAAPERVCVLTYDDFTCDPAATLEKLLAHSKLSRSRAHCRAALDHAWADRASLRYNKGQSGRGAARFSAAQLARLRHQLEFYPNLAPMMDLLIPPPSASSPVRAPSAAA